jgi:hypothetical protein
MTPTESNIQQIIAARKQRWVDFYDLNQPARHMLLVRWMPELPERPWPHDYTLQERIEWAWKKYQLQLAQLEWLEDDTLPFLDIYTGTEIFAAAFGCRVYYPPGDMPFALPLIQSASQVSSVQIPDLDAPAIAHLFTIADELRRRAGSDALVHMVDLQSPMDIAALIWDKTQFYPAMIQEPEAVHALADKIRTFQIRFLEEWFARYGREFIAHYPDYYMPRGITLSEDEIGAVSGKMFHKFFLPEITALSEHFGGIGIHCCAHARHQWANLKLIPGLKLLNLNQPVDVLNDSIPYFADTVAQWPIFPMNGPAWEDPAQIPTGARVVVEVSASSREEAEQIVSRWRAGQKR